jgi:predicted RNase H-like nuclease (RuvC/YqgF family)
MDNEEKIKKMEEHISNLETELQTTKEHLKKYTAPASRKVYYERNKELENVIKIYFLDIIILLLFSK